MFACLPSYYRIVLYKLFIYGNEIYCIEACFYIANVSMNMHVCDWAHGLTVWHVSGWYTCTVVNCKLVCCTMEHVC